MAEQNTTNNDPASASLSHVSDAYLLSMRDALVRSLPAIEELRQTQEDLGDVFSAIRLGLKQSIKKGVSPEDRASTAQLLDYIKQLFAYFDASTKVLMDIHKLGSIVRAVGREQTER